MKSAVKNKICLISYVMLSFGFMVVNAQQDFKQDKIKTNTGNVVITLIGHGSLMMEYKGITILVDPSSREADYAQLPKADAVFITHQHGDHFDMNALSKCMTENTKLFLTATCAEKEILHEYKVLANGENLDFEGIGIDVIPAYNLVHKRSNGQFFHPKGEGNGYVFTFADTKIYIAGDTENIPEMKALNNIDVAFLPMNLPYTMTPEMVADAAKAFKPKILYPYHFGNTDVNKLVDLLKDENEIEVRIRDME